MTEIRRCPICKRSKTKAIQEQASQKAICGVQGCVFAREIQQAITAKSKIRVVKKTKQVIHVVKKNGNAT
jgi:hypothetical protein